MRIGGLLAASFAVLTCYGQKTELWPDPSPHAVRFIPVDNGVKLEVLDWGGSGRAVVLLAGLGNTAHVFDDFAPKLAASYHVYGITRRGFGGSGSPEYGYSGDRLGDDVLEVLEALKLDRPVLAGHSIAGEELSSVATRHPEKVSGLVYLDAGYGYAYYDPTLGDAGVDSLDFLRALDRMPGSFLRLARDRRELQKDLTTLKEAEGGPEKLLPLVRKLLETSLPQVEKDLRELRQPNTGASSSKESIPSKRVAPTQVVKDLLETMLPVLERDLRRLQKDLQASGAAPKDPLPSAADLASFPAYRAWRMSVDGFATPEAELRQDRISKPDGTVGKDRDASKAVEAILSGMQKYTHIRVPVLAIFVIPHGKDTIESKSSEMESSDEAQAQAFEKGIPGARVVLLPHAEHSVFLSNEADVLREMVSFLGGLR